MSAHRLSLEIPRQPDLVSCGPACLQAAYRFFDDHVELDRVISEVRSRHHPAGMHRLIRAILLGVLMYDANLLILEPGE